MARRGPSAGTAGRGNCVCCVQPSRQPMGAETLDGADQRRGGIQGSVFVLRRGRWGGRAVDSFAGRHGQSCTFPPLLCYNPAAMHCYDSSRTLTHKAGSHIKHHPKTELCFPWRRWRLCFPTICHCWLRSTNPAGTACQCAEAGRRRSARGPCGRHGGAVGRRPA